MAAPRFTLAKLCPRWEGYAPGTRVACDSPYVGREVVLRRGEQPVTVTACSSPPPLSARVRRKASIKRQCAQGFEVSSGLGISWAVEGSKIRERLRDREGLCPDALRVDPHSGFVAYEEREARKAGRSPYEGGELPFPHREGSTPCCKRSPVYPDKIAAMLAELESGEGFLDAEDVVAAARRMVPKAMRRELVVNSLEEIPAAIEGVRSHCWGVVKHWESMHERSAGFSAARESAAERRVAQLAEDLGATVGASVGRAGSKRRVEATWTDADEARKSKGRKAALTYFRAG